jgi:hypothetical protein
MLRPVLGVKRVTLAAALACALLGGCGSEGQTDEEQVRGVVAAFGRATASKDYGAMCDRLLAADLVEKVTSIGLPCEVALGRGLGDVKDPQLSIGKITVDGDKAKVEVRSSAAGQPPSSDILELSRARDGWRISSLGA